MNRENTLPGNQNTPQFPVKRRPKFIRQKHLTSDEVAARLLEFIRIKFYPGAGVDFAKHRRDLLNWVVLWPAAWLVKRGTSLPGDQYYDLVEKVLMDAARHQVQTKITYYPAYLKQVIQSHFAKHEDEIYDGAKAFRATVDHALLVAGRQIGQAQPDPVRELARMKSVLRAAAPKKLPKKAQARQLDMF